MLNGLDLFSGIGGLTIALREWVNPIAYCEIDKYAQAVLVSRMSDYQLPRAPIWDNVETLNVSMLCRGVDIIYGGFPCQDISENTAGQGLEGKRSGLFWEIVRLAKEIKPDFIFLENVRNIRSRGLGEIAGTLADLGYDLRWDVIPAYSDTNFFEGERWFCLGTSARLRCESGWAKGRNAPASTARGCHVSPPIWNPLEDPMAGTVDGVSPRVHRLRGLGNGVVPHQAREAFMRLTGLRAK